MSASPDVYSQYIVTMPHSCHLAAGTVYEEEEEEEAYTLFKRRQPLSVHSL